MILAEPEKYRDVINAIKKDIAYMLLELKKNLKRKYYLMNKSKIALTIIVNF